MKNISTQLLNRFDMINYYRNEYGELEQCFVLSCSIVGNRVLIELDDVRGYCSENLLVD